MNWVPIIISSMLGLLIGGFIGFAIRVFLVEKGFRTTRDKAKAILEEATTQAERLKKEKLLEAKQEIHNLNLENEKLIKEKKSLVQEQENKLNQREDSLERRSTNLDKRESNLDRKEEALDEKKAALEEKNSRLESIIQEQNGKLLEIAKFSEEQAKAVIMERVEHEWLTNSLATSETPRKMPNPKATKLPKTSLSTRFRNTLKTSRQNQL